MTGTLKKTIAFLLILSLFIGILPTEGIIEELALREKAAAAEEERSSRAAEAADSQERRFGAIADEAAEKMAEGKSTENGEWRVRNRNNTRGIAALVLDAASLMLNLAQNYDIVRPPKRVLICRISNLSQN